MKREIFRRGLLCSVAAVLICAIFSAFILQREKKSEWETSLQNGLTLVSETMGQNPVAEDYTTAAKTFARTFAGARLTIIDRDGKVIGDSHQDPATMQNHADRPEVQQALKTGIGVNHQRFSQTLGTDMSYIAVLGSDGYVYRAAQHVGGIDKSFTAILPAILASVLLAVAVAAWGAGRMAKKVAQPVELAAQGLRDINAGQYDKHLTLPEYDELAPLIVSINSLAENIENTLQDLEDEKKKSRFLLDNIADGLIAVDTDGHIVTINRAAREYLQAGGDLSGKTLSHATYDRQILEAVQRVCQGQGSGQVFDLTGTQQEGPGVQVLSCSVLPVRDSWLAGRQGGTRMGAIIVLRAVTEERLRQQMRSEFFQNASHELKTPITSIGGFAQLLQSGMVKDPATRQRYLDKIVAESERMGELIGDILKISKYEESPDRDRDQRVDIPAVAQEVLERLQPAAARAQVKTALHLDGSDLCIAGSRKDLEELLSNLCDNAVKYNRPGGTVDVRLHSLPDGVQITVADTGIGIARVHLDRIFERFYRVDKDRNKQVGGTGLGLSIVKHIANRYGGTVEIQSAEGRGTTLTVTLRR